MPRNKSNKWKEKGHGLYEKSTVPEQTTYSASAHHKPGQPQRQRQRRRGDAMGVEQSHTEHAHPQHSGLIEIKKYVTNNGLDIICYKGDITKADADGIVTTDNCGMPKPSMVTAALLKTANINYDDLRRYTYHKYNTIDLTSGEVYTLETHNYEIQLQVKLIYLAIVLPYKHSKDEQNWTQHTERLYRNILERADYKRSTSVAVPLLGSGKAGAPRDLAVDTLITALSQYRPKYSLTTVLLVSLDEEVLIEILNQWDEYFSEQLHVPKKRDSPEHVEHRLSSHHNQNSYGYNGNVSQANQSARRLHSGCVSSNLAKQQTSQSAFPSQKFNNEHDISRQDIPLRVYQPPRLYPVLDNMGNQPTCVYNKHVKEPTTRPSLSAHVSDNTAQMTVAHSANIQETFDKQPIEACSSSEIQPSDTNYDNTSDDIFATGTHSTTESTLDWDTSEHNGGQLMANRKRNNTDEQFSDFVIIGHNNVKSDDNITKRNTNEDVFVSASNEQIGGQSDRIVTRGKEKDERSSDSVSTEQRGGQSDRNFTREIKTDEHLSGSVSNGQPERNFTRGKEKDEHLSGSVSNEHDSQSDRNFTRGKEKDEHSSGSVSNGQRDRNFTRGKEKDEHSSGSVSNGQTDRNFTRGKEKDEHLSGSVSNGQSDRNLTRGKDKDEHSSGSVSNEQRGRQSKGNFPIERTNEQDVSGSACCGRNNRQKDGNLNAEFSAEQPVTQSDKTVDNSKPLSLISKRKVTVNQPDGRMTQKVIADISIPGYEGHGVIVVDYYFEDGIQTDEHPHPGKPYQGVRRRGFLPDNAEGQAVLLLLKKAFDCKLTFSITPSTEDENDIMTWNISHKTNTHGGRKRNGYPDETYLSSVKEELERKGVTE